MRQTYGERMHLEREKANQTRLEREAHQRAVDLVFGAPSICRRIYFHVSAGRR